MGYRFGGKQRKLSFGPYPVVTLVGARDKRDAAKRLLADGIDPGVAKQQAKREQAAARTFGKWADEWLGKERTQLDEKTMAGKERYVRYLKGEFGNRLIPAIKRPDVLLYLKEFEKTGKLETRDRIRAAGEQICVYADIEGNDSFTVVRPGEVANAEWTEFANARWTIPAGKMKMKHEHVVPLSRQALAILKQVKALTGGRRFVLPSPKPARSPSTEPGGMVSGVFPDARCVGA